MQTSYGRIYADLRRRSVAQPPCLVYFVFVAHIIHEHKTNRTLQLKGDTVPLERRFHESKEQVGEVINLTLTEKVCGVR